ncbi:hypothetical protein Desdi_2112 [Desulfitobacterium dichloroeliminans LMG P-21439]|uniref:Uncharacterized protein n=1 Tax=Desulfitobacterium dichloroeliminans (strain LMG P-21439 / DCA1) TaxID=871963 RepID=L0F9F3_DESDL|nr:hypothetical protein [Desulfitobacterium dichloroeliminans]AGA69553.1 hypothetical protein Desdi_2112 [Desulfitobacterium dichloroeliminans LMG P-21439]
MKLVYLKTDFPNGRSHILMKNTESQSQELNHFVLVLTNKGTLWVDVFWPYDDESERYTRRISEQHFWQAFREWRLAGFQLGDNEQVATVLARRQLNLKKHPVDA